MSEVSSNEKPFEVVEIVPNTHYGDCLIFKALRDYEIRLAGTGVRRQVKTGMYHADVFNRKLGSNKDIITDNELNNLKQRIYIYENR